MAFFFDNFSSKYICICAYLLQDFLSKPHILCRFLFSNQPDYPIFIEAAIQRLKWCFENMQQIYSRTLMSKCEFNRVAEFY